MKAVTYKKILLTHDGSDFATAALPHVIAEALAFNAEVAVLQIVKSASQIIPTVTPAGRIANAGQLAKKIAADERKLARNNVARLAQQIEAAGVDRISGIVKKGRAADEIITFVKKNKYDLVVMSTHGRSGIVRVLLGSVADEVLRYVSCPVLLIHPGQV